MELLLKRIYDTPKIKTPLKIASYLSVLAGVFAFCYMEAAAYISAPSEAVILALVAGVPFVLVSISRVLFNAPRPYEKYKFYERMPKSKLGRSFPSRHVFSAFLIGTLAYTVSIPLMIVLLVFGVILAVSRVLLGIHFIRDVVAGCFIGVLFGVIGIVILK